MLFVLHLMQGEGSQKSIYLVQFLSKHLSIGKPQSDAVTDELLFDCFRYGVTGALHAVTYPICSECIFVLSCDTIDSLLFFLWYRL